MLLVIGSGPAGVACASALLAGGAEVVMLDAGLVLESDRQVRLEAISRGEKTDWSFIREGVKVGKGGIPLKMAYGSAFPYREMVSQPVIEKGAESKASFARGGLSNVWGASVLPFRDLDIQTWPFRSEALAAHYRAVLRLMPFAACHDGLAEILPLYHEQPGKLAASSQAQALLADLGRDTRKLEARGIRFGAARLAVQAQEGNGCVYCGQCIYGCPYGYIYNSSQTLAQLLKNPKFSYRSGLVVESVDESATEVTLRARTAGGESVSVSGERVFLACGVLSTARIILTSLGAYERPLSAADNCYFLLPLLRQKRVAGVTAEALHTLAQIFIEVEDAKIGPYSSHLQIYTYNDLFRQQIANSFGPLHGLGERLLLGRLLLIQGYLHSELSPKLKLTLRRGKPDVIVVEKEDNSKTRPALRALQQKLLSEWRSLRAVPVTPMLNVGKPGRGFHTGGTFPMRNLPSDMETDLVGRLHGFERLHLVDASVLPSLPATTITLSVMANAHRIGSEVTR